MDSLAQWLAHCERLHPQTMALGLERVQEVVKRMDLRLTCPVITVAGTNGKGSTCAMLEACYQQAGYRTGVYTSPHLVHFEERCRLLGESVAPDALLPHFARVEAARTDGASIELTYFEFTTLAILSLMSASNLDVAILEVGLGGRLDAVNVINADCAVLTSIDLDHMDYLGPDRESIGREKAGVMRTGRPVIVSDPMPPHTVIDHAREIGADLWCFGQDFNFSGDKQQWGWAGRGRRYAGLAYPALRGANQLLNASGVLAALEAMREALPVTAQAIRNGLAMVSLPGRFQIVPGQPTLVLDVAHNPHAAAALAENLDAMGFYPTTHAVFGAMADKDLTPMLSRLSVLVDRWYFCDLPTPRAASGAALMAQWQALQSSAKQSRQTSAVSSAANTTAKAQAQAYADPLSALRAAIAAADPADRIVVFGSFFTVGGVLADGIPRLDAPHLGS
jgi:dihydrofolate synthase/folylpolyglutamate synthase